MLSSPAVYADSLFCEEDVTRLLEATRSASSLKSQQAMVDVASRRSFASSARQHRPSPARSPAQRRRQSSSSPSRPSKHVRFDLPAPTSALKSPRKSHFRDYGSCPSPCRVGGCLAVFWRVWESRGAEP